MVVGFNHNFRYKGEVYHVQTEDGGRKSPNIITLLYKGGTILSSKKTAYADIIKVDNLERVVEELMKDQHREMLRRLKNGEFDALIEQRRAGTARPEPSSPGRPLPAASPPAAPSPAPSRQPPPVAGERIEHRPAENLDEIILSYLVGDES